MDLNTVTAWQRPASADEVAAWEEGAAWLAGGTWLFSEPQPAVRTLIDMGRFGWPALTVSPEGLEIAATCKIAELHNFVAPAEWTAAPLFRECCRSLLASFKIWNEATVGGNICLSLPAGAMISLAVALEGILTLWPRRGAPRTLPVAEFVTGDHANVLAPGELLRSIFLPLTALKKNFVTRRFSLTQIGRSSVFLLGTRCPESGALRLVLTAATTRPVALTFSSVPSALDLKQAIDAAVPTALYFDDPNGSPAHRRHLTYYYAEQIRAEWAAP